VDPPQPRPNCRARPKPCAKEGPQFGYEALFSGLWILDSPVSLSNLPPVPTPAILALEDGRVFHGTSFGATGTATGEACFNTSMTGYQEILTDPSYRGQVVTMTYPQIGNYGVNPEDTESSQPHVRGFVIGELCPVPSNFRSSNRSTTTSSRPASRASRTSTPAR
jgi:hypothetical protein